MCSKKIETKLNAILCIYFKLKNVIYIRKVLRILCSFLKYLAFEKIRASKEDTPRNRLLEF